VKKEEDLEIGIEIVIVIDMIDITIINIMIMIDVMTTVDISTMIEIITMIEDATLTGSHVSPTEPIGLIIKSIPDITRIKS